MKKLLLALALWLTPFAAFAQCTGVFPPNNICGTVAGGVPGPVSTSVLTGVPGGTNGQIQYNNSGSFGGATGGDVQMSGTTTLIQTNAVTTSKINGAAVTNAKLATGSANTTKGSLDGSTTSDIAIASCSALYSVTQWVSGTGWQCGINPVIPSRAIAATLNLSAFTAVTTQGYATAGDGGGATFKKLGAGVPFQDTYVSTATLVGGSGYGSATYNGVPLGGGSSFGCSAQVVVSGGIVTQVNLAVPCSGYKVGDVLTTPNVFLGSSGSGFTWTVTAISTPTASFTDNSGNNFQFIATGIANILQFGAVGDWNGTDGSSTNNAAAFWSAESWASVNNPTSLANVLGNQILVPFGSYLTCGAWRGTSYMLPTSQGVWFHGSGVQSTSIVQCSTETGSDHLFELCDSNFNVGQYGCKVSDMAIIMQGTASANTAAIYSLTGQQFPLVDNVEIIAKNYECIHYDVGKGGAANATFTHGDCEQAQSATANGITFGASLGGTQVILEDWIFGCAGTGCTKNAVSISGGTNFIGKKLHIENMTTGFNVNNTGRSTLRDVTMTTGCTSVITLTSTNPNNTFLFENIDGGSCAAIITNGHSGGSNLTTNFSKQLTCGTTCS